MYKTEFMQLGQLSTRPDFHHSYYSQHQDQRLQNSLFANQGMEQGPLLALPPVFVAFWTSFFFLAVCMTRDFRHFQDFLSHTRMEINSLKRIDSPARKQYCTSQQTHHANYEIMGIQQGQRKMLSVLAKSTSQICLLHHFLYNVHLPFGALV